MSDPQRLQISTKRGPTEWRPYNRLSQSMNLFDAIFNRKHGDVVAVEFEHQQITYDDLRKQTLALAGELEPLGIKPGDRVAILLNDSPEFIACFISICSAGAIAVPINMALRLDEQRLILNDCMARVAIVEAGLCNNLLTDAVQKLTHLKDVVVIDRANASGCRIEGINVLSPNLISGESDKSLTGTENGTPAFILYTSGSTGEPKGAVHSQADMFYTNATFCREVLRLRAGDRLFSSSRLPFAYGLGNSFTFPLLNGLTTILCREKPTPEVIARIFRDYKPTIFFGVPVIYNLLLEHHRAVQPLDCSSLHMCISAGEALPAQLGHDWETTFGVEVLDGIGSTEMLHMWMSNQEGAVRYGSSGKVLKGYAARLLDEQGQPTAPGLEGNLWVKGESAAMGYWQNPEATKRTFVDGWVRTGDRYRCDADGYWFHMGRSDDCFKSRGQWVSPVEVEGVLLRNKRVSRAAVVEDFDEDGLPCVCAFVVVQGLEFDSTKLEDELQNLCRSSLPRFKRPSKYIFVKDLPYTATGKIQRFKLREGLRHAAKQGAA